MSGRGLSEDMGAAVAAATIQPIWICEVDTSTPVRVWTGFGNLTWDSKTWLGIGTFGGVTPVGETTDLQANGFELQLSGIPSAYVSLILSERLRGKSVKLWFALYEVGTSTIISDPVLFAGRANAPTLDDSAETATLRIPVESPLIDLQRPRESRWTDAEQKRLHPGDRGFEYVAALQNKEISWGSGTNAGATAPDPGLDNPEGDYYG